MKNKFTKILEICLLVISLIGLIAFFVFNGKTGLYSVENLSEALATTSLLDMVLFWAYIMVIAALVLVVVLSLSPLCSSVRHCCLPAETPLPSIWLYSLHTQHLR